MSPLAPEWLVSSVRLAKKDYVGEKANYIRNYLSNLKLSTVCESAQCPNRGECFSHNTATFLILGEICTRGCSFCAVKKGKPAKRVDEDEPERLANAVAGLGLRHVVITSVTRDDLTDGGASHYIQVVQILKQHCPGVTIELLIPDFGGSNEALAKLLENGRPEVLAHNLETVPRLYSQVRKGADYYRSVTLLKKTKEITPEVITKSGLMLGFGEKDEEVEGVLHDLRGVSCDMLTLGQYLSPSLAHIPVANYITPEKFAAWRQKALDMGFKYVAAGPLVRSSYKASGFFEGTR